MLQTLPLASKSLLNIVNYYVLVESGGKGWLPMGVVLCILYNIFEGPDIDRGSL